jgi:hypothetical protein
MGVSSGKIAVLITYKGLFAVETCIAAVSLFFIIFAFKLKKDDTKDIKKI